MVQKELALIAGSIQSPNSFLATQPNTIFYKWTHNSTHSLIIHFHKIYIKPPLTKFAKKNELRSKITTREWIQWKKNNSLVQLTDILGVFECLYILFSSSKTASLQGFLFHIFWITLSLALRLRVFSFSSCSDGDMGLFVKIVASRPCTICLIQASLSLPKVLIFIESSSLQFTIFRNARFTILSSRLWNEMTASLPPQERESKQARIESLSVLSSSLTAIRKAWKTRVAVLIQPCLPPVYILDKSTCQT